MFNKLREKYPQDTFPQTVQNIRVTGVIGVTIANNNLVTPFEITVTPQGYTSKSLKLHGLHQLHLKKQQKGNDVLEGQNEVQIQGLKGVTSGVTQCNWWLDQAAIKVRFDEIAGRLEYQDGFKRHEAEIKARELVQLEIAAWTAWEGRQ
jgi:hypothetical protein